MQFFVAFVATLACAFASSSAYSAYAPAPYAAPAYPAYSAYAAPYAAPYAGAYAHAPAPVTVLPSGFLADTPEVAHAKSAHLAEVAKVASKAAYAPAPYGYAAPYAAPYAGAYAHAPAPVTVLPSGFLADTPEVAHAKAAHLAEKAKVASKAAYAPAPYGYAAPYAAPYAGAYAHAPAPVVLPSGFLADTPEVAHAKAAHLAEKAKVAYAPASYAAPAYTPYSYAAPAAYAAPAYYGAHY